MSVRVAMVVDRFPQEPFLARLTQGLLSRNIDLHILCQTYDRSSTAWSMLDRSALEGRVHAWPDRGRRTALMKSASAVLGRSALRRPGALATAAVRELGTDGGGRRRFDQGLPGRLLFDARVLAVQADVIHFQFGDLAQRRQHVAHSLDCGFSSSFRGYDLAYAGIDEPGYYDSLWPALDGAHTLGRDLRNLARRRGCPADLEWTLIPPAVDAELFRPLDGRDRNNGPELNIVSVGRLHWKKGYAQGVAAVAGLRAAGVDCRYRIVGSGDAEEELRWHINDHDLQDVVELAGPIAPDRIPFELANADVFLHPALTEGFGNAVLEAQSAGLPVVCTDAEGLAENVVHDVTGFVVPRHQPTKLQRYLAMLAADAELRERMGRAGRARVINHFSHVQQIDAFVQFFESVHQRRRQSNRPRPTAS